MALAYYTEFPILAGRVAGLNGVNVHDIHCVDNLDQFNRRGILRNVDFGNIRKVRDLHCVFRDQFRDLHHDVGNLRRNIRRNDPDFHLPVSLRSVRQAVHIHIPRLPGHGLGQTADDRNRYNQ